MQSFDSSTKPSANKYERVEKTTRKRKTKVGQRSHFSGFYIASFFHTHTPPPSTVMLRSFPVWRLDGGSEMTFNEMRLFREKIESFFCEIF